MGKTSLYAKNYKHGNTVELTFLSQHTHTQYTIQYKSTSTETGNSVTDYRSAL
jgi:hypothetical protein